MKYNVIKAIEQSMKLYKKNDIYCATVQMIRDIINISHDDYDLATNGFHVGYWQGYKAAMKEGEKN